MSKHKHTPGPWFVDTQGAPTIRRGDGTPICGAPGNPADAPLLAAAPDTLAHLKIARNILRRVKYCGPEREAIDAAIDRAEGRA